MRQKIAAIESRMLGSTQPWTPKPPPLRPNGTTAPVGCDDIDALNTALATLRGKTLALSDGHGPDSNGDLTWMRPKVIPLTRTGTKPHVTLDVDIRLVGHSRSRNWITLLVEGACGTRGELRLNYPSSSMVPRPGFKGWQLHVVTPHPSAVAPLPPSDDPLARENPPNPLPELANEPEKDTEGSEQKRDDIFRKMFG